MNLSINASFVVWYLGIIEGKEPLVGVLLINC